MRACGKRHKTSKDSAALMETLFSLEAMSMATMPPDFATVIPVGDGNHQQAIADLSKNCSSPPKPEWRDATGNPF